MSSTPGELEFVERPQNKKAVSALALRVAGHTLEEICEVVGFASVKEATNAIDRALRDELKTDPRARDKLRDLANKRLERLLRAVWVKALDPKNPEQMQAVGKSREIIKDVVSLYGLAAPTEMVVHSPDSSEIEAWVMSVLQKDKPELEEADVLDDVWDADVVEDNGDTGA